MDIFISLIAGLVAGFMSAITAGTGVFTIPVLIFLGLPANSAIATNALITLGMIVFSLPEYYKAKKVQLRVGLKLIPLAILGGVIGSQLLIRSDANILNLVVGILLLLMIPVILLNPKKGIKPNKTNKSQVTLGYIIYFLTMVYGGFLAAGAGIFAMYALVLFFGMTYMQSKATISVPGFFLTACVLIIFLFHGLVDFKLGVPMTIGACIGGFLGARTAIKKGDAWVRVLFIATLLIFGIKLVFFH